MQCVVVCSCRAQDSCTGQGCDDTQYNRYELWCVARAVGAKYCVVYCATTAETARTWNAARNEADAYTHAVFEDLARRFEAPDSRNRWDKPLYEVLPGQEGWEASLHVCPPL